MLKTISASEFTLEGEKYVGPSVCIEHTSAAVQVKTDAEATVTVERAVNGKDFTEVTDFSLKVTGTGEFNVVNAVRGQWIRIASTIAPLSCNILT